MKGEENTVAGNESNNSQNTSVDNTQNTSADTSHTQRDKTSADSSTTIFYSTANKAVQVFIPDRNSKVKKRTRRIQTGKSKTTESQVQCDEVRLCCNCLKSMGSEGGLESVKSEDRSTYMIF